jgi:hypothetical protein
MDSLGNSKQFFIIYSLLEASRAKADVVDEKGKFIYPSYVEHIIVRISLKCLFFASEMLICENREIFFH